MRRAFTLIELLVVVAILAAMVAVGVGNVWSGQAAARVKGAARDVYAAIRHARSIAIVTGQRVIVNYSNENTEDGARAKVEVVSAKILGEGDRLPAQPYEVAKHSELAPREAAAPAPDVGIADPDGTSGVAAGGGTSVEEVLFAPMDANVVKGMRLKVQIAESGDADETAAQKSHRISVSSNVDWLLRLYRGGQGASALAKDESGGEPESVGDVAADAEMPAPVSVIWQTNGAVEPHDVWIYPEGRQPEDGLLLRVDRFGAVKVLNGDGREER